MSKRIKEYPNRSNNIWNKYDFIMIKRFSSKIRHFGNCIKWSKQRIVRGFSDYDVYDMYGFMQKLIPNMLRHLKENRTGSPGFLGQTYTNKEGYIVNDTCHEEWDNILDKMIFLWNEMDETTCSKKNIYEAEYTKAYHDFESKHGFMGSGIKLKSTKELRKDKEHKSGISVHFMDEFPEYKDIDKKYREEELKLEKYRNECKDEAFEMMKEYFFALWD